MGDQIKLHKLLIGVTLIGSFLFILTVGKWTISSFSATHLQAWTHKKHIINSCPFWLRMCVMGMALGVKATSFYLSSSINFVFLFAWLYNKRTKITGKRWQDDEGRLRVRVWIGLNQDKASGLHQRVWS